MTNGIAEDTEFLNVDLDIHSTQDLKPLAEALRPTAHALYCERARRGYFARLELSHQPRTPEEAIRKLAKLIAQLPRKARQLWSTARTRDLNIGIQSGPKPWVTEYAIEPATLAAAARLGARVVVTVYGRPTKAIGIQCWADMTPSASWSENVRRADMTRQELGYYTPRRGGRPEKIHRALAAINAENGRKGATAEAIASRSRVALAKVLDEMRWGKHGNGGFMVIERLDVSGEIRYRHTKRYRPNVE